MRGLNGRRQALLAGVGLLGCQSWSFAAPSAAQSRRIVSVGGALTETLFALGAMPDLVGVDTTSIYPEAVRQLPSVGYARSLSAEGVLSLRPTLIVATEDAGPPAVLRQLEAARIPMAVLSAGHRFEGLLARTQGLAELSGRVDAGRQLVDDMRKSWAQNAARPGTLRQAGRAAPRVLFVLSHSMAQLRVAGRDTAADAMIGYAGTTNALADLTGYKPLTPEAVIAAAPDIILATEQGLQAAGGAAGLLRAPGLAQTPAGRAGRVVALDALFLLGFGPRLPQAVAALMDAMESAMAQSPPTRPM